MTTTDKKQKREPPKRKTYSGSVKQEGAEDSRAFNFVFSSAEVDRDRDTIDQLGIDVKPFKTNPVVLWAHDMRIPPVARVKRTWIRDEKLMGTIEFPPEGVSAMSDTLHGLVKNGFINAVSIGFAPIEWTFNEERGGIDLKKIELWEVSLVPVPSQRDALRTAEEKGIEVEQMEIWAKSVLGDEAPAAKEEPGDDAPVNPEEAAPVPAAVAPAQFEEVLELIGALKEATEAVKGIKFTGAAPPTITTVPPKLSPKSNSTAKRYTVADIRSALKGVVTTTVQKVAAEQVREHTGRLED